MRAALVVDLGFGDAGKGLVTDFLVRRTGARAVVRFNGGAQAGHNVVTPDGRHHTFAQLGAGTFVPGVATCLSRHVLFHPTALLVEERALRAKGVGDAFARLRVSARARVVTPYHQAANRLRELARGEGRHGSCGVGIGEAAGDAERWPEEALLAGELADGRALRRKLGYLQARKRGELQALALPRTEAASRELSIFEAPEAIDAWIEAALGLAATGVIVADDRLLDGIDCAIFEGAQGVLLDERHGFAPHTTWSRCTFENALELLGAHAPGAEVVRLGVLRSHAVRHGPGPLPTEAAELDALIAEPHNRTNPWQGPVRHGWFDAVLARHALACAGGVDALALTHLDTAERLPRFQLATAYRTGDGRHSEALPALPAEALTAWLSQAQPSFVEARELLGAVETALHVRVAFGSRGPSSTDVRVERPDVLPDWLGR